LKWNKKKTLINIAVLKSFIYNINVLVCVCISRIVFSRSGSAFFDPRQTRWNYKRILKTLVVFSFLFVYPIRFKHNWCSIKLTTDGTMEFLIIICSCIIIIIIIIIHICLSLLCTRHRIGTKNKYTLPNKMLLAKIFPTVI